MFYRFFLQFKWKECESQLHYFIKKLEEKTIRSKIFEDNIGKT